MVHLKHKLVREGRQMCADLYVSQVLQKHLGLTTAIECGGLTCSVRPRRQRWTWYVHTQRRLVANIRQPQPQTGASATERTPTFAQHRTETRTRQRPTGIYP